jgi:signal transduction histidine kinase/PAS domain-containing protein
MTTRVVSTRNHLALTDYDPFSQPATRFVTDFAHMLRDVDQLMFDILSAVQKKRHSGTNGVANPRIAQTISVLREDAQSFVKSLEHFQFPADRLPMPYLELDARGRILRANEEGKRMLNAATSPVSGKSLFSFIARGDVKRLREQLSSASQTDKPSTIHLSIEHGGKLRNVALRLRRQVFGKEIGYIGVVEDNGHVRAMAASAEADKRHSRRMHDLVVSLTRAQTLKSMANSVAEYCGKTLGGSSGMIYVESDGNMRLLSQWRSGPMINGLADAIIRNGPVVRAFQTGHPLFMRRPHRLLSRYRCQSISLLPITAPGQDPVGVLAVAVPDGRDFGPTFHNDLHQLGEIVAGCILRARAYDTAIAARVQAENAARRKEEFISIVSHELRNPMMPILGWADALRKAKLPPEKQHQAVESIIRNVKTLNYLIEDLFDAARIASGKFRLQPSQVLIQDVAREALMTIEHTAQRKKLRISTQISDGIPPIIADSYRLRQVLTNLLNNAVKFTQEGGLIELKVHKRGDKVECVVSDNGKGIPPKFLPIIFDKFQQGDHSTVSASGLGLGLGIVREIVELHNGSIRASSRGLNKGSTFVFRLPIRTKQRPRR